MKKKLVKTVIVVAIAASSIALYEKNLSSTKVSENFCHCLFSPVKAGEKTVSQRQYIQVFASQTTKNLKLYHSQLQWLNPAYEVPTEMDLVRAVHSHPNYIGKLKTIPNVDERVGCLDSNHASFYLFQLINDDEKDYYVAHANGVRHFSIHSKAGTVPGCDNSGAINYPTLNRTIHCTVG